MGQSRKRLGRNGDVRFTAYYDDLGGHRSAGTFPSLKLANKAWQQAEARVAEGRGRKPAPRPRQLFERYVEDVWFPNHVMELTTRQNYTYSLNRHIMSTFAGYGMIDVLPADVREWVATLHATGVKRPSGRHRQQVDELPIRGHEHTAPQLLVRRGMARVVRRRAPRVSGHGPGR